MPKMGSNSSGPTGSSRAVPHLLMQGWRSVSVHAGGDFAELEQRNGSGGDPRHRGTQAHSCHQLRDRKQESLLDYPDAYLEKLRTRWIFLSETQAQFLLSSPLVFKLLNLLLHWPSRRRGWCAAPSALLSPQAHPATLYTRGVSCGKAERCPASPGMELSQPSGTGQTLG